MESLKSKTRAVDHSAQTMQPLEIPLPQRRENLVDLPDTQRRDEQKNIALAKNVSRVLGIILVLGLVLTIRVSYLYSQTKANEAIQDAIVQITNRNDLLHIQISKESSLEVLEQKALSLGFVKAEPEQYRELKPAP